MLKLHLLGLVKINKKFILPKPAGDFIIKEQILCPEFP